MKKRLLLIIIMSLFFIPYIVNAETCDISKITITSMEQKSIEGNTEEVEDPTFKDRNINFNLKMYEVGDSITYDMTIKNDSKEDYMIDEDTFKTDSKYIIYTLKTNDGSNVVKAKSNKDVTLIVEYKKEVDSSLLNNNKFDASNNLKLSLNTSLKEKELNVITTNNIKNPLTGYSIISLIILVLLVSTIIYLSIYNKKKLNKYLIIVVFLIPISVYGVCKVDIEVESIIEIEKLPKLFDTVVGLANEENACVTKYEGDVTDEVNKTVSATKVYFDKCSEKRNVIFGGFCWQVIRTTETGGTKLVYNGEPVDGKCESTRENHTGIIGYADKSSNFNDNYLYGDSFTYDETNNTFLLTDTFTATLSDTTYENLLGKYTCKSTSDTCTKLYQINNYESSTNVYYSYYTIGATNYAQIGTSPFNASEKSPAMVGYMFNKTYNWKNAATNGDLMGNKVSYSNGTYTLLPFNGESELGTTKDNNHHYTCYNRIGTCNIVRYYFYLNNFILLSGEESIDEAVNNMLYADNVNKYNSSAKGIIDAWYAQNLLSKRDMLEDTVYCNARNMINQSTNGWNENGEIDSIMHFKNRNLTNDLSCSNVTDQFAVNNNKAKLTYPVALINIEEWNSIGINSMRNTGAFYWSFSPKHFGAAGATVIYMKADGSLCSDYEVYGGRGLRPAISLNSSVSIAGGTGLETDPWIIK